MKVFKKTAVAGFLVVTIFSSMPVSANAGLFDWFSGKNDGASTSQTAFIGATGGIENQAGQDSTSVIVSDNFVMATKSPNGAKISPLKIKIRELMVPITAYSSTPDQCDDSPFVTANGTYVHEGTIAANFLPFGTKIKIPSYFGDKIFTVEDRMNKRYWQKIDVWFPDRESAKEFGLRTLKIQILES